MRKRNNTLVIKDVNGAQTTDIYMQSVRGSTDRMPSEPDKNKDPATGMPTGKRQHKALTAVDDDTGLAPGGLPFAPPPRIPAIECDSLGDGKFQCGCGATNVKIFFAGMRSVGCTQGPPDPEMPFICDKD